MMAYPTKAELAAVVRATEALRAAQDELRRAEKAALRPCGPSILPSEATILLPTYVEVDGSSYCVETSAHGLKVTRLQDPTR